MKISLAFNKAPFILKSLPCLQRYKILYQSFYFKSIDTRLTYSFCQNTTVFCQIISTKLSRAYFDAYLAINFSSNLKI